MKIVHLNTYDGNGGAGRAVLRLNAALKELGADSEIVSLYQFNPLSGVKAISQNLKGKIHALINIMAERFLVRFFLKDRSVPFSLQRFGVSPRRWKILQEADVIHIHWINHGMFAPKHIAALSAFKGKKIFWTFHDSNPLTGGCHVRYTCPGYLHQCGNCPVLNNPGNKDLSHQTWKAKNKAYQNLDFSVIGPSEWMAQSAREASLTKNKRAFFIPNALETNLFRPTDKQASRKQLAIPEDALVILAGYMPSTADRHKGLKELEETLRYLSADPTLDKEKLLLVFYGSNGEGIHLDIPISYWFAGKISNDEVLVSLYNAADVFLFPSLEESMGYTALESLSCGTPVAGFNTSGVTDVVIHKQNGYLADLYDTQGLARGVAWILNEADRVALARHGRQWAVTQFGLQVVARKHLDLYSEN